jgi:hypothetical protein
VQPDLIDAFCDDYHDYHAISPDRRVMQRRVLREFEASLGAPLVEATAEDLHGLLQGLYRGRAAPQHGARTAQRDPPVPDLGVAAQAARGRPAARAARRRAPARRNRREHAAPVQAPVDRTLLARARRSATRGRTTAISTAAICTCAAGRRESPAGRACSPTLSAPRSRRSSTWRCTARYAATRFSTRADRDAPRQRLPRRRRRAQEPRRHAAPARGAVDDPRDA